MAVREAGGYKFLETLFANRKYSDLTIKCGDNEWKVHKAVVCSQSAVLEAAIDKAWKESQTSTVIHDYFDAATVERFLSYLYLSHYTLHDTITTEPPSLAALSIADTQAEGRLDTCDPSHHQVVDMPDLQIPGTYQDELIQHVLVYGIGDFYDVEGLKKLAASNFKSLLNEKWSAEGMISVIEAVCTHTCATDQALRAPMISKVAIHLQELRRDEEFERRMATNPTLQDFLQGVLYRVDQLYTLSNAKHSTALREHSLVIQGLEASLSSAEADTDLAKDKVKIVEQRMESLFDHLRSLNTACYNANCDAQFDGLSFELKGNGEWRVRCQSCKCKIIK